MWCCRATPIPTTDRSPGSPRGVVSAISIWNARLANTTHKWNASSGWKTTWLKEMRLPAAFAPKKKPTRLAAASPLHEQVFDFFEQALLVRLVVHRQGVGKLLEQLALIAR